MTAGGWRRWGVRLLMASLLWLMVLGLGTALCLAVIALPLVWTALRPVGPALFLSCCALALLVLAFWYPVGDAWRAWRRARGRPMATRR